MSDPRLERVFRESVFPMTLVDHAGIYVAVNEAWSRLTGIEADQAVGRSVMDFCPPEDRHALSVQMRTWGESSWPEADRRFIRPDGVEVWVRRAVIPLPATDDQPALVLSILHEITEARLSEERMASNDRAWRTFTSVAPVAVFRILRDGTARSITPRWSEFTGQSVEESLGYGWADMVHPEDRRELFMAGIVAFETANEFHHAYRVCHRDGSVRWLDVRLGPVLDDTGRVVELVGVASDITELKSAQDRLAHLAACDDLTGLPNRRSFRQQLHSALSRAERAGTEVGVIFCDLDGFKHVNDRAGHDVGDAVLCAIAERLQQAVRLGDVVARIGGDEFVVLCEPVGSLAETLHVADRLSSAARTIVPTPRGMVEVGVSIGVALSHPGVSADGLIAEADSAMYRAKAAGSNLVEVFEPRAA